MGILESFPTDLPTGLPVAHTRALLAGQILRDMNGNPRPGLVQGAGTQVVTGTSTMAYSVKAIPLAITSRKSGGAEWVATDSAITTTAGAVNTSGNPRIDIVYLRARFAADADGASTPEIGMVSGTPNLVPTPPAIPAGGLELARATIPSGVTSTLAAGVVIAQTALPTAGAGDILRVWSDTARNSVWGTPATEAQRLALQNSGALTMRLDRGNAIEGYFATYNASSNPRGMPTPGWYEITSPERGRAQGALAGSAPPVGTPLIEYTGSTTVTTNASGDTSLVLPAAFPNGLISVHLDRLNFANYGQTTHIFSATQALDRINFRVFAPAAAAPVANASGIPYIYTAKGW